MGKWQGAGRGTACWYREKHKSLETIRGPENHKRRLMIMSPDWPSHFSYENDKEKAYFTMYTWISVNLMQGSGSEMDSIPCVGMTTSTRVFNPF